MIDIDQLKWNEQGLIPVITQDVNGGQVLALQWMNREALEKTLQTGYCWYWRRSHRKLMAKGESSGHRQLVREVWADCDADCLLMVVEQIGGACHTGYRSCFYRRLQDGEWQVVGEKVFEPEEVYG